MEDSDPTKEDVPSSLFRTKSGNRVVEICRASSSVFAYCCVACFALSHLVASSI
jgi:hypothetical protein